jgi:hypothetical protein
MVVIPEIATEASQETAPRVEFARGPQHEGGIENFDGSDWEACIPERLNDRLSLHVVLSRPRLAGSLADWCSACDPLRVRGP